MSKEISNEIVTGTLGRMKQVNDFLPKPEELIFKTEETVKVSLVLDKESVDFFKAEAKRLHASYQRMIRNLLQDYTQRMKQGEQGRHTT